MALKGLNFVGAVGVKKRRMRLKSCVSKFFVAGGAGSVEEELLGCWLARGGSVAAGCAMVEGGGSVINPHRLR